MYELFTIGYSSFSIKSFIEILSKYNITAIADVRSSPYSRFKPEFVLKNIKKILSENNIAYIFLGDLCSARIDSPECYGNGKVNFKLIEKHEKFAMCLNRIKEGMKDYRIALMCAEKDPITCHRTILICRNLRSPSIKIRHILENGSIEEHADTEKRLMRLYKLDQSDMYRSEVMRLEEAYDLQGDKIAFVKEDQGTV